MANEIHAEMITEVQTCLAQLFEKHDGVNIIVFGSPPHKPKFIEELSWNISISDEGNICLPYIISENSMDSI